jgi:hypothetical protein
MKECRGGENRLVRIPKIFEAAACLLFLVWLWKANLRWLWVTDISPYAICTQPGCGLIKRFVALRFIQ